jgi:diaminopimelate epimerase
MARNPELRFVKGHGTGNDFILIPDLEGEIVTSVSVLMA